MVYVVRGFDIQLNAVAALFPVMLLIMGLLGLGLGILFTSLTTKYRDLVFLIQFGVQLLMYATPVIYPLSTVPQQYRFWFLINPMTPVLEGFRYGFLGTGSFEPIHLAVSGIITMVIFFVGLMVFNYTEKDFMDIV
jgi:lipopolysaccharide transport system permease protein